VRIIITVLSQQHNVCILTFPQGTEPIRKWLLDGTHPWHLRTYGLSHSLCGVVGVFTHIYGVEYTPTPKAPHVGSFGRFFGGTSYHTVITVGLQSYHSATWQPSQGEHFHW